MRHFFKSRNRVAKGRSKERCKCIEILYSSRNSKVMPSTNREAKRHTKKETEGIKRFPFPPSNPKIGTRDENLRNNRE
jgi:hypothetical protein